MRAALATAMLAALLAPAGAANLVGQWTFDLYQGSSPLDNKAPGVMWSPVDLTGWGATAADGKLVLPRYQNGGVWKQSSATAFLMTDLGPSGHFREMTLVAWVKWPGFDAAADWPRIVALIKFPSQSYSISDTRAAQSIVMKATDDWNWGAHRAYEPDPGPCATQWAKCGGFDPPTDCHIKVAQVVRYKDASQYEQIMYWDTGGGLVQIGSSAAIWSSWAMPFGQCGSDCLVDPAWGKRYDALGIMDYCWNLPQSAGEISFEEIRVYSGAMSQGEIAAMEPVESPAFAPEHLIGQWTFDNRGGTGPTANKASGAIWDPLTLSGSGATISGGKLRLAAYYSGGWTVGQASALLKTVVSPFKEKTSVLWLTLDRTGDANDAVQLLRLHKTTTTDQPYDAVGWSAGKQFYPIIRAQTALETSALPYSLDAPVIRAGDPVKLAAVWHNDADGKFTVTLYLDQLDGKGLNQYGSPMRFDDVPYLNTFGDADNDCFRFVPSVSSLTGDTFGVSFEEARLYDVALTREQIAGLVARQPEEFFQADGASLKRGGQACRGIGINSGLLFHYYANLGDEWSPYFPSAEAARQYAIDAVLDAERSAIPFIRLWTTGFYPIDMAMYFEQPDEYWKRMDEFLALCTQHHVALVPSIFWNVHMWPAVYGEDLQDINSPSSATYQAIRKYAREIVLRYRDDPNIVAWEIGNEYYLKADINVTGWAAPIPGGRYLPGSPGAASPKTTLNFEDSLATAHLLQFYNEMKSYVRGLDPNHLIESGDSMRRNASQSLKDNFPVNTWIVDTLNQNLWNLHESQQMLDLFSLHMYGHEPDDVWPGGFAAIDFFREEARFISTYGFPLFVGELGQYDPYWADDPTCAWTLSAIDMLESEGADLMALWAWYMPMFPKCDLNGTAYPLLMNRVRQFNNSYWVYDKPAVGATCRSVAEAAARAAAARYRWVLWGRATIVDADSFTIDDGSGATARIMSPGHNVQTGDFVSVRGHLDANTTPPTVTASTVVRRQ